MLALFLATAIVAAADECPQQDPKPAACETLGKQALEAGVEPQSIDCPR